MTMTANRRLQQTRRTAVKPSQSAVKSIALAAIAAYQRYISPYKGFCCAYRSYTGHRSCSVLGYRAIRRYGVLPGLGVLRKRLQRCSAASGKQFQASRLQRGQRGFCDIPSCDLPCDIPSADFANGACDALNCVSCPCDCGDWWNSRRRPDDEEYVYGTPRR